jgi:hypothetical protein
MTAMTTVPPAMTASEITGHAGAAKASTSCCPSRCETAAGATAATEPTTVGATGREPPAPSASMDLGGVSRWNEGRQRQRCAERSQCAYLLSHVILCVF